jgi:broad specificity phosphatase PhoE
MEDAMTLRRTVCALLATLVLGLMTPLPPSTHAAEMPLVQLIGELRKGGFVIYFRHGETGSQGADRPRAVMGDCSTQRNLNEEGRRQVVRLGEDFTALRIPVGTVLSSEFCRCWQHAEAMFGKGRYAVTEKLSLPPSYPSTTAADRERSNEGLKALLAETPAAGANTVLVSHGANILMLTGFHPSAQGEAIIFRPHGKGGFERIVSVRPEEWSRVRRELSGS